MSETKVNIFRLGIEEGVGVCYALNSWGVLSVAQEGDTVTVDDEETEVTDIRTDDGVVKMGLRNGKTAEWDGAEAPQTENGECDPSIFITDKEMVNRMAEKLRGERSEELLDIYVTLKFKIPLPGTPSQEPEIGFVHRLQSDDVNNTSDDGRIHIEIYEDEGHYFVYHRLGYPDSEPNVARNKSREPVRTFGSLENAVDYVIQKSEFHAKRRTMGYENIVYELDDTISDITGVSNIKELSDKTKRYVTSNKI